MNVNRLGPLSLLVLLLSACGSKNDKELKGYVSIVSLIEKQVKHLDTSYLYAIQKVVITDSLHQDTSYIKHTEFRAAAKEFLEIPDLSIQKVAKRYKDEPVRYDEMLGRVIMAYRAIDPKKEEYNSQELIIKPNLAEGDKITNIIVSRVINQKDGSSIQKNLLWQIDKSFQITTTVLNDKGEPEKTTITQVSWIKSGS